MACEQVTSLHPSSAEWGDHPSGVRHEIVDLAIWKEHHQPKRPGQAALRRGLATKRPRPGADGVDIGGDDKASTTSVVPPVRNAVLPVERQTGA